MQEEKSSYRQIMKATSLFGGVQVFNIIIQIIRSKVIAVLLGPAGMGISGLLTATIAMIRTLTNFGLGTSAVRDIAEAHESGSKQRINKVITVLRKLVWFTGFLGSIFTFIFSPLISQLSFGNKEYTVAFMWLSCTLLFNQLASGQNVLLQGMRKLQHLAKANMIGSAIGLVVSVPLYYFYGIDGIVPSLVLSAIFSLIIAWYFARKVMVERTLITRKEIVSEGKGMMKMGFMLSLSGFITMGASYIVRVFISNTGSIEDVGLYNAGFAIIGTYVGLVFAAMGTDFYPRLSGVAHDNKKASLLINQQAEIGVLILGPILAIFLVFINWVVIILYSTKFIPVNGMLHWAALGMYFKIASWSIGFILLAKGNSKLFFLSELVVNIYMLVLNIAGYYLYGLDGLGISFLISFILVFFQVYFIAKYKYGFSFNLEFYKIFGIQFLLGLSCFMIIKSTSTPLSFIIGIPIILISSWFSLKQLDDRLDLKSMLNNFRNK